MCFLIEFRVYGICWESSHGAIDVLNKRSHLVLIEWYLGLITQKNKMKVIHIYNLFIPIFLEGNDNMGEMNLKSMNKKRIKKNKEIDLQFSST
jgi:hypothetical protein